ncbi:cysteine hydrolase family protein [Thermodesulfobacteriota bacterium]
MDRYTRPEWKKSALVSIDVQRDFIIPGTPLCHADTPEALASMHRLTSAYREWRLPIVHVVRLYKEDGSNVDLCRRSVIEGGKKMAAPGSRGSQPAVELLQSEEVLIDSEILLAGQLQAFGEAEWVIYKSRWGAFYKTILEEHLTGVGVNTIVLCGLNYPNCPRTAVFQASERDFRVVFVSDAVSGTYERGMQELGNIGVSVMTTDECLTELNKSDT